MVRKDADAPTESPRARGAGLLRFVYGAGLVALGACLGIVIGSLSETPRLLLERLRGPVETVELAPAAVESGLPEAASPTLERFDALQEGTSPKAERAFPSKPQPAEESEPPPPLVPASELTPAPSVAAAPPAQAPATGSESPPESKSSPAPTALQPPSAVVQVASYVERKPAEDLVVKLKDSGFDAYVSQPAATNGRYRVRIRPTSGESAGELAKRLRGFGFDTWATSE